VAYGVCYNTDGGSFDYLCGVEVLSSSDLPQGFIVLDVPSNRYAIFHHGGHVTDIHTIMRRSSRPGCRPPVTGRRRTGF
jgi:AraC family transcriptional regulator